MKLTLLEMVQDILNDMDSDNVNSIDDTVEAQQVAQILKTCYHEMMTNRNWPHQRKLVQLEALANPSRPNYLYLPENVKELETFSYDKRKFGEVDPRIDVVKFKEPDDFLRYVSLRKESNDNVIPVTDFSGSTLLIINDTAPTYWTSFDDTYIITDSYDAGVDTTLRKSKTQCLAYVYDSWVHEDDAIPVMPASAFSGYLEEAKSTAFFVIKQMANQKAEQKASRQQRWLSRKAWRAHGGVRYEDYGRKSRK